MLDFDETYWLFTGKPAWGAPYEMPKDPPPGFGIAGMIMVEGFDTRDPAAYQTPKPMTKLSYTSKLIEIASSGKHHGIKTDPESLRLRLVREGVEAEPCHFSPVGLRLTAIEAARGEIARTARSALAPAAQPYQDLIDHLLYALAGLTEAETTGLEERLARML